MKRQNLLVIMSDEHNPKMLSCAGHPLAKTPHLDRLAAQGVRFDRAYTSCPICVPARASFATGRYVHETGYWDNSIAYEGKIESWGHHLQSAGIRVESIGKLHYRMEEDPTGFDKQHIPMHIKDGVGMVHLSIREQFPDFTHALPKKGGGAAGIVFEAGRGESEYTRYDRKVADLACDWLRDAVDRDEPWTLFVSFVTPHYPLVAPDEFFDLYPIAKMPEPKLGANSEFQAHPWLARLLSQNAGSDATPEQHRIAMAAYLGLCSFMDAQVGRVLDALENSDQRDRARVIYTSDHGENAGARGMWGKSVHYEEATGIPLIVAGADIPEGQVCATPVTLVDAFPTILQAADIAIPNDWGLPGKSWFDMANEPDDRERIAFSEYHASRSPSGSYMIRKGRFKYIYYVGFQPELFDLETDPEEENNLSGDPAYADTLRAYETHLRTIVDPIAVDQEANDVQKALILSRGGPDEVMANLVTTSHHTPVPDDVESQL
jgi:choline-sulfatase